MTVVVDTNVLIDYLRARPEAGRLLDHALTADRPLLASTVTKVEILAGMRSHERPRTRRLLDVIDWEPVTDPIAERAAAWAREYGAAHPHVCLVDYAIAATAEEHGAELWTRDVRRFPMFGGLQAPY